MFGKVIYFDEEKINEYKSVILGKKNVKINQINVSSDKGIDVNIPIINGNVKANKNYSAEIIESLLLEVNEFERVLNEKNKDDYFDFTTSNSYDITTIQRGVIIKFDGIIVIPYGFDITDTLHRYKKYIIDQDEEYAAFFDGVTPKIPLLVELDKNLLSSKLDINNLKINSIELDDYENIEVTILARMISSNKVKMNKPIYDPLKDYIKLNRQLRRELFVDRPDELSEIYADDDYYQIEVIVIYQ